MATLKELILGYQTPDNQEVQPESSEDSDADGLAAFEKCLSHWHKNRGFKQLPNIRRRSPRHSSQPRHFQDSVYISSPR